ncbi:hypothetical protein [Psychroserpens algicola]|uniref:DUF4440 domain-containing protein n=1 Tax=Psychroserpens algicola TaxID=1719034 RepID=A0ABT0H5X2_9FLAO|nr:hypothetical protein [Psychroserpens algicola]MCK8479777.1 hypothetical protein [Psychroserpens algicola]
MKKLLKIIVSTLLFSFVLFIPNIVSSQNEKIENEIYKHGEIIRKAFYEEDIEKIKSLHHPEVIKALGYNDLKIGRKEVMDRLKLTFENYKLKFLEYKVEHILIKDNIAIEQSKFSIKLTHKSSGKSFVSKGRTMVTYIRDEKTSTGWATIREIIQPSTE